MLKMAFMTAILAVVSIITLGAAPRAYAQEKLPIDLSIYNRCKKNNMQLFIVSNKPNCLISQHNQSKPIYDSVSKNPATAPTPIPTNTPVITTTSQSETQISVAPRPDYTNVRDSNTEVNLNPNVIFSMVNNIRVQNNLPPFQQDANTCSIAQSRAPELYAEIFINHDMHAGFYSRNFPYWITENIIYERTESQAVQWWMNEPVHRAALLSTNQYSCVACQGEACSMVFTSYLPK